MTARIVFAVSEYTLLPKGPLVALEDQDHESDGCGCHMLHVQLPDETCTWVSGVDVTDGSTVAGVA